MHRSKRYFDLIHLRGYRAIRTSTTTTNSDQRLQAPSKRAEALSLMTERGPLCDSEVERSQPQANVGFNPICRLARAGLVRGNASEPARYPEPSGTDADRQCGVARDARVWRTWNFAALDRGHTSRDIMGSLLKRASSWAGPFWCRRTLILSDKRNSLWGWTPSRLRSSAF